MLAPFSPSKTIVKVKAVLFFFETLVTTYQTKGFRNLKTIWYIFVFWFQGRCTFPRSCHIVIRQIDTYCTKMRIILKIFQHASFQNTILRRATVVSTLSILLFPVVGGCLVGLSAVAKFDTNFRAWSLF